MAFVRNWLGSNKKSKPLTNGHNQNEGPENKTATITDIDSVQFIIDQSLVDVGESEGERKMIGEGAFAKVYKGRYKDGPSAVKIFTDEGQENAKSELSLAEKLSEHGHENIVLMLGILDGRSDKAVLSGDGVV